MNTHETMADLAGSGRLEGRRVRLLVDVGWTSMPPLVPAGTIGVVLGVNEHEPKALFAWTVETRHEGHPWREVATEGPLCEVELVP